MLCVLQWVPIKLIFQQRNIRKCVYHYRINRIQERHTHYKKQREKTTSVPYFVFVQSISFSFYVAKTTQTRSSPQFNLFHVLYKTHHEIKLYGCRTDVYVPFVSVPSAVYIICSSWIILASSWIIHTSENSNYCKGFTFTKFILVHRTVHDAVQRFD
jgi:hypothetical protein